MGCPTVDQRRGHSRWSPTWLLQGWQVPAGGSEQEARWTWSGQAGRGRLMLKGHRGRPGCQVQAGLPTWREGGRRPTAASHHLPCAFLGHLSLADPPVPGACGFLSCVETFQMATPLHQPLLGAGPPHSGRLSQCTCSPPSAMSLVCCELLGAQLNEPETGLRGEDGGPRQSPPSPAPAPAPASSRGQKSPPKLRCTCRRLEAKPDSLWVCGGGFSGLSQVFGFRTPVGIFWADAVMSLAVTQCRWVTEGGREVLGMNPADSTIFLWPL